MKHRPLVGVIVDGISSYGRGILRGVMRYANLERRWLLYKDLRHSLTSMARWPKCDGMIVAGVTITAFQQINKRYKNCIFCSGTGDPAFSPVVALDDEAAGAMAAGHLMDCRLQRFAFYGATMIPRRFEGFRAELERNEFTCAIVPVELPSEAEWLTHAKWPRLMQWLQELPKPAGIMAGDDTMAHDLAAACLEAGIAVPEQIAIIGVNNDDLLCESAWPPLSSIEADYSRMGYHAAKLLDRLFAGEVLTPEERLTRLPPLGVVQRQSTNILALDNPDLAQAVRFIREHACDPCSVDDVLRVVPVGRRWLERQFLSKLGRTPHDEIVRVRIDKARVLLLQPEMGLIEIAQKCGYSGIANFHVAFKNLVNNTPAAYRRAALRGRR
jgi:LacI family transcriptional regulator